MENLTGLESNLAWIWVIEALASFKEVGPSLLHDLVDTAPELPDDLGKNTNEMVALKCLEGLFAPVCANTSEAPSVQDSKVRFDLSESCEDVLQRILQGTSVSNLGVTRSQLSKWDIQPFIKHKRACMSKCALEKLKYAILDGIHPYADFLGEKSGLAVTKGGDRVRVGDSNCDSVSSRPSQSCADGQNVRVGGNSYPLILENRNNQFEENLHNGDMLPSKRTRFDSATEVMARDFNENSNNVNNSGVQHMNFKRVKQYASSVQQFMEQNKVPLHGQKVLKDSFDTNFVVTERGLDSEENNQTNMEEGGILEDGYGKFTVSRSQQNNNGVFQKKQLVSPHISSVIFKDTGREEAHHFVNAGKSVSEHSAKPDGTCHFMELNSVPLLARQLLEDASERDALITENGHCSEENWRANVEEGGISEDGCNECTGSKRSQQSNNDEFQKNQPEIPYNAPLIPEDTNKDESHQSIGEPNGVNEHSQETDGAHHSMEQNSAQIHGREPLKDPSVGIGLVTESRHDLGGNLMESVEECRVQGDGCNDYNSSKNFELRNNDEFHRKQVGIPHNAPIMPQETSQAEAHQYLSVDEAQGVGKHCAETSGVPSNGVLCSAEESNRGFEHDLQLEGPSHASHDGSVEAKECMNGSGEVKSIDSDGYHNETIDVATKKREFLNSQSTTNLDSAMTDSMGVHLCMKCSEVSQLLVCSIDNCPLVVHEKCLSSSAIFDDKGNFYCPFCSYSLAITEYLEAKKESSLVKKKLEAFIHGSDYKQKESTDRSNKGRHRLTVGNEEEDLIGKNHENVHLGEREDNKGNHNEINVHGVNYPQCHKVIVDNQQVKLSASCNNVDLKCIEKRVTVISGMLHGPAGQEEGKGKVVQEFPSVRSFKEQQNHVPGDCDNGSSENTDSFLVVQRQGDSGIQQKVLKHVTDAPEEDVYEFDGEGHSEDDSELGKYFLGVRKRNKHCAYWATNLPKKKKWTDAEEKTLKEGVQIYAGGNERKIPWKTILEFGESVFQEGRTPVDLKDKWRNMSKGTSK
ncbi:hypothetical protein UlMin_022596 [Ulmus minor]